MAEEINHHVLSVKILKEKITDIEPIGGSKQSTGKVPHGGKLSPFYYIPAPLPKNSYDQVLPDVYLGNSDPVHDKVKLKEIGITHILNAAQGKKFNQIDTDSEFYADVGITFHGVAAVDFPNYKLQPHFAESAQFIADCLDNHGKIYIHCRQGLSRSATLLISYMMIIKKIPLLEAAITLRQKRPILPNDGFLKQLIQLNSELFIGSAHDVHDHNTNNLSTFTKEENCDTNKVNLHTDTNKDDCDTNPLHTDTNKDDCDTNPLHTDTNKEGCDTNPLHTDTKQKCLNNNLSDSNPQSDKSSITINQTSCERVTNKQVLAPAAGQNKTWITLNSPETQDVETDDSSALDQSTNISIKVSSEVSVGKNNEEDNRSDVLEQYNPETDVNDDKVNRDSECKPSHIYTLDEVKQIIRDIKPNPFTQVKQTKGKDKPTMFFVNRDFSSFLPVNKYDLVYPGIYLGDYNLARDVSELKRLGITHIVNTAQGQKFCQIDTSQEFYADINATFFGIKASDVSKFNMSEYFHSAADFIDDALKQGGKLYIHCHQGMSRSATVTLCFLMLKRNMSLVEAIRTIRKSRAIMPNDGFIKQLIELQHKLY